MRSGEAVKPIESWLNPSQSPRKLLMLNELAYSAREW